MRTSPAIEQLTRRLEAAQGLDRPADRLAAVLRRVVRPGPVEDALTGTTLGHPLHPVLVGFPIGAWAAASVLDLARADRDARRMLVGLGVVAAVPTALSGASDWLSTAGAGRRVGLVHAAANNGALALEAASWLARRRGRHVLGTMLSVTATGLLGSGLWASSSPTGSAWVSTRPRSSTCPRTGPTSRPRPTYPSTERSAWRLTVCRCC
jgi:uncharacterized membrane protein